MAQHTAPLGADGHSSASPGLSKGLGFGRPPAAVADDAAHGAPSSELSFRTLFESSDDGFCIIEKVTGRVGAPVDFVYIEANRAFSDQSGVPSSEGVVGKTIRQLFPSLPEDWLTTYDDLLTRGAPMRFERELGPGQRWLEVCVSPITGPGVRRLAVLFKDITARVLAEQTLRETEAFSRSIVDSSPDCIKVLDLQGHLLSMRNGQKTMHIHDVGPYLNKPWLDFWQGDDRPAAQAALAAAAAGEVGSFVGFSRTLRGVAKWWDVVISPIMDADQRPARLLAVSRDVTERKQAEDVARLRTAQFETLFDYAPVGVYLIDADVRICQVNPRAMAVFGPIAGLIGSDFAEVMHILWQPEDAARCIAHVRHTLETGEALVVPELVARRADRQVTECYEWQITRLPMPDGRLGVVCHFRDISERVATQRLVSESETRFRALFDHGPIAMYCVDAEGVVQEYNHNAVALWGREPVRGDPNERYCGAFRLYLSDGSLLPHATTPVVDVLSGAIPSAKDVKVLIERPDGSRITVIANVVPLKNALGEITGAINCLYDVTERSRLAQITQEQATTLAEMGQRKDEFLAMLSHELRNPLAPISNAVRVLRLHNQDDPVQVQARTVIERQVGQLNHLVDDLLEVSRITTGRVQLRPLPLALGHIVERAVESTQPLITQRRHALTVALPAEPLWVCGDAARLEQVVVNLLTNAAKYTDEGGVITVSLALEAGCAVLRVLDTGIGIAPELLPRVFELFTQAERSLDRSQGGLGIGLCLVQRMVELHGGTVDVHSVLGQGSEFVMRLPAVAAPESLPAMVPAPAATPITQGCRVLVVDDNLDAAQTLSDLLRMTGHEVHMVHDGLDAVTEAVAWCPDVVLLDISLPGLSGFEVAKRIRREAANPTMTLVALTGYGQAADRQRSHEAGFDHHLVKPADFDAVEKILTAVVQESVSRSRIDDHHPAITNGLPALASAADTAPD